MTRPLLYCCILEGYRPLTRFKATTIKCSSHWAQVCVQNIEEMQYVSFRCESGLGIWVGGLNKPLFEGWSTDYKEEYQTLPPSPKRATQKNSRKNVQDFSLPTKVVMECPVNSMLLWLQFWLQKWTHKLTLPSQVILQLIIFITSQNDRATPGARGFCDLAIFRWIRRVSMYVYSANPPENG